MKRQDIENYIMMEVLSNAEYSGHVARAMDVRTGVTVRFPCPSCEGGSTKEHCLAATSNGVVVRYICHRAGCGIKGTIGGDDRQLHGQGKREATKAPKFYQKELRALTQEQRKFFLDSFSLGAAQVRSIRYAPEDNRFWFPVYALNGYEIGGVLRSYVPGAKPKTLSYKFNPTYPFVSWYLKHKSKPLVIVEDCISAMKVGAVANALALNGTYLSAEVVVMITNMRPRPTKVVLALDPDATSKANDILNTYSLFIGNLQMVSLSKDPKEMTYDEIRRDILGEADISSGSS